MCEYVDHLHEHFTSPVVIHDAHYMPPKVRGAADGSYKLLNQSLHLKKKKKSRCFSLGCSFAFTVLLVLRIQDILARCWNHQ